ncbi:hypothetical protein L1987_84956 [Smallanthus sonchifolius]|uniref:Uncharacterized protein n=1 Tax=Smallanthus sonchifolius TaxID=185202 RepID=A0ACB8XW11_9ASTR|nr:hypothetical protein L1987_84956 [Smallanthus sonchifolius]
MYQGGKIDPAVACQGSEMINRALKLHDRSGFSLLDLVTDGDIFIISLTSSSRPRLEMLCRRWVPSCWADDGSLLSGVMNKRLELGNDTPGLTLGAMQ